MAYFNELPNIEVVNRTSNRVSNDETIIVKNLFKRGKLREDISSVVTAFVYYNIEEDERPDQVAQKVYGNSELDWVVMLVNNIINVNDDWPISKSSFDNYLLEKYGSEEELNKIRYYETIELKDIFGRVVLPAKLIVDESFYKAPEYAPNDSPPPGITFPEITSPGTVAIATAILDSNGSVVNVSIGNTGKGYKTRPNIYISDPPITSDASAEVTISNFGVSQIINLNGGQGYNTTPLITIDSPPQSIQASAECLLNEDKVGIITNLVGGLGYGNTAPTIEFESPRSLLSALFLNETFVPIGDQIDGMYVRDDGYKLYTSNGIGPNLIREYDLTTPWNSNTVVFNNGLDISTDFSYCSGIDFKPDGTRMFICGGKSGQFKVVSYNLSTPWSISTATKAHEILTSNLGGIRLNVDGNRMYLLNAVSDVIEEYILGTPWNISTKGAINTQLNVQSITGDVNILGFSFFGNGKILFVSSSSGYIYQFNLSTNWNVSTASLSDRLFVGDKLGNPSDVFVKPNRKTLFMCGGTSDKLFEYSMFSVAEGTAILNSSGSVTEITITNPGTGYTVAPKITISAPYLPVNAIATANLSAGIVTSVTIVNSGFGYTTSPNLTIESAPISIKARLTIRTVENSGITSIFVSEKGLNYQTPPTITIDQPDDVTNVNVGDIYTQVNRTWKWSGTEWEEKITEEFGYLDLTNNRIVKIEGNKISRPVTNYEYEINLNDEKKLIKILKREYLSVLIGDLREMMSYDPGISGYINEKLKSTYNPKLTGV